MNKEMINKNSMETFYTAKRVILALTGILILFCVIGPNMKWIISPLTPSVKVTIREANSSKPISNMQVIVSHNIRYVYFPGSGNVNYSNAELLTTNADGEFYIKRRIKPISLSFFGLIDRDYEGTLLITLNSKYKYQSILIQSSENMILNMNLISSYSDLKKNYDIYNLIKGDNYPSSIKTVIDTARIDLAKKLGSFKKS